MHFDALREFRHHINSEFMNGCQAKMPLLINLCMAPDRGVYMHSGMCVVV